MSSDFQPGDFVVCISNDYRSHDNPLPDLNVGDGYRVAAVLNTWHLDSDEMRDGLDIAGHVDDEWCYAWRDFRRTYRPDPLLIERLTAEPVFAPPVKQPGKVKA